MRQALTELDQGFDETVNKVDRVFSSLRKHIEDRENSLLTRLEEITTKRRNMLQKQLSTLVEIRDDCNNLVSMSDDLLKEEENSTEAMNYIVGLTDVIEDRSDSLAELVTNTPKDPVTITHLTTNFFNEEISLVENIISTVGSIEAEPVINLEQKDDVKMSQSKKEKERVLNLPEIYFSVTSDVSDNESNLYEKRNRIIIEARSAENLYNNDSLDEKISNKGDKDYPYNVKREGRILGKISLSIEFDKNLLSRHELRSFFETSVDNDGVPYMTVSKDFVST